MRLLLLLLASALLASCSGRQIVRDVQPPSSVSMLDRTSPTLKVHHLNGRVSVLENWRVDTTARQVIGTGALYDINRIGLDTGAQAIALDSIALLETNVVVAPSIQLGMVLVSIVSLGLTVLLPILQNL